MTTSSKLTTGLTDVSSILGPIRDIRKSCSHWPFDVTLKYFFTFKILPSLIWVKLVQKFLCWKMSSKFSFAHDDDVELLTVFCKSHLKSRSWNDQMSSRHKIAFDLSQQTVTTRQWQCHYTGWPKNMKKCVHLKLKTNTTYISKQIDVKLDNFKAIIKLIW